MKEYLSLNDLRIYNIARELSNVAWNIYKDLKLDNRIIIGKQFVRAIDSVGANIAEGYGRYHYLDKVKFYYNARASLFESFHWLDLLKNREFLGEKEHEELKFKLDDLHIKLNAYIKSIRKKKYSNT